MCHVRHRARRRFPVAELACALLVALVAAGCGAKDPEKALGRAQDLLAAGDHERAFAAYAGVEEETGHPLAQFMLGMFHKHGWGRPADPAQACAWFEKAARGDIPVAQHYLAEALVEGVHRPADPARAAEWYERAATGGHLLSYVPLAELHLAGRGVPRDPKKALDYCLRAARKGVVPAQVRAGRLLLEARNVADAYGWLLQAAQRDDPEAQHRVGVMTRDGLGCEPSAEAARDWFERAAAQGYLPAYLPTAELYFGDGSEEPREDHLAKSYMWLSAASQRSTDPRVAKLLARVMKILPDDWRPDLDQKVAAHLRQVG